MQPDTTTHHCHDDDQHLVARIRAGSTDHWHAFLERYAGLAYTVARRHLHDDDDARDVTATVFERLYHGGLHRYDGRAALSTWLVLVVRNAAIDALRHQRGRQRLPVGVRQRPLADQRIYELYFVLGWPADVVQAQLAGEDLALTPDAFWQVVSELMEVVDPRLQRRLRFEQEARQQGLPSGRWLEYHDHVCGEATAHRGNEMPDAAVNRAAEPDPVALVQAGLARLTAEERHAVDLRYQQRLSAREIATELDLDGQRQAFTLLERAVRKLRRALGTASPGAVNLGSDP